MARASVGKSDPDTRKPKRSSSSIGALASMRSAPPAQAQAMPMARDTSIGSIAQPTASEAPPRDNEEFQQRVKRNFEWAQAPEVQAALMQFAMGMTAPVNSPGDFMGNITRAVGGGFQAASRVHDAGLEEAAFTAEEDRKDRRLAVDEGQLGIAEKRLALDEAELNQKLRKGTTNNIVVSADNPINKAFNLGIPAGSQAKVAVTVDAEGNVTNASVEAGFEGGGGDADKSSNIEQLQKDRAEAVARGDTKSANEIDQQISAINAGAAGTPTDMRQVPDPEKPGQFKLEVIPGSKLDIEQKEIEKKEGRRNAQGLVAGAIVNTQAKLALDIIDRNPMPDLFVTGIGGLIGQLPIGSDSKDLANALAGIKSNISVTAMQAIRNSNPTGAAFGNVSDYETELVQSIFGQIDQYGHAQVLADNIRRANAALRLVASGNTIGKIGEQIQAGILTEEQGLAEVEALINAEVAKAANEKAEMAREAARAGGMPAGETPLISKEMLNPETTLPITPGMIMNEPTPAPKAALTPEEQNQIDVEKQMKQMIEANKADKTMENEAGPIKPDNLSEVDSERFDNLEADDKRVWLQARKLKKEKKKAASMGKDSGFNVIQPSKENPDITKATPDDFITLGDVINFFRGETIGGGISPNRMGSQ